jgi:hypothetical protein
MNLKILHLISIFIAFKGSVDGQPNDFHIPDELEESIIACIAGVWLPKRLFTRPS